MRSKTITAVKCVALLLLSSMLFASGTFAAEKKAAMKPDEVKAKQAYALGVSAYIWGSPMVVMQTSRDAMTKGGDAPVTPKTEGSSLHS